MGGYGSGRPSQKEKIEGHRSLNVNKFHRDGCLVDGQQGNWRWHRDGAEIANIGFSAQSTTLTLNYRVRIYGGEWEPIVQAVPIERVACHYGNQRPYFRCSGVVNGQHCNRRVTKLYAGGRYFCCRHCYNFTYASQSEAKYDRALRKANKLGMALGGEAGTAQFIAPKPKGMWHRTYQKLRNEIEHNEYQANCLFLSKYRHLVDTADRALFFDD
jgi:hypothetical protein